MSVEYTVFRRSCRNFKEFANAQKVVIRRGLEYSEAQRMCDDFNNHRTQAQIKRGTKYEFTSDL